ncbi:MAG TPA: hypothetical protein VIR15_08010 [Intrasporangium sp.]|jgi:Phage protein Gp19/Gp15/Gp42.|uniref:hypothetical protein n=1 Tax=Intrasporangium sp. TaxID=1925024 RepID=UPI002F95FA7B
MAFTTTVTPAMVAVALGQSAPASGSPTEQQWQMWIDDALMLIQLRADDLAVAVIDQARLDYVVREAVVAQVRRPDSATQVTVSVDDASTSKTYRSSTGRIGILDEWWSMLGLTPRTGRAFEVDTMPAGAGVNGVYGVDYVWVSTTETGPVL